MNQKAYMHATFTFTWLAHGNFLILHASRKYSYQTPYFNLLSLASFFYKQIMGFFEMCKNISPFRRLPILYQDQNLFSSKKKKKGYRFYCQAKAFSFFPFMINKYLYLLQESFPKCSPLTENMDLLSIIKYTRKKKTHVEEW